MPRRKAARQNAAVAKWRQPHRDEGAVTPAPSSQFRPVWTWMIEEANLRRRADD
jgi:hypothetical protein